MKDLLITRLKAHRKYMYSRILNVQKGEAFDRCIERIINILNTDKNVSIYNIKEHPDFISIRNYFYNDRNKNYHNGVYFCIDVYNEICDNFIKRFEDGYTTDNIIEKL